MPLITIVIVLVVIGVVMWIINTYIPMAGPIKTILNVVVVLAVVIWLLNAFGVISTGAFNSLGSVGTRHATKP